MASASCFAKGVDHWWPLSDELHRAPEIRQVAGRLRNENVESSLVELETLLFIIQFRSRAYMLDLFIYVMVS